MGWRACTLSPADNQPVRNPPPAPADNASVSDGQSVSGNHSIASEPAAAASQPVATSTMGITLNAKRNASVAAFEGRDVQRALVETDRGSRQNALSKRGGQPG
ncbi:hypothetical protein [Erwinia sp. E_sp_B01_9]|uniref:hypothetical protein n=1 Tax=Erwinia sp. E_sp_B01_9 TaxID=3039403 RepID=UPI003D9AD6A2